MSDSGGIALQGREGVEARGVLTGKFREWSDLRNRIARESDEPTLADLLRRQNAIFSEVVATPAATIEDALHKLALWRWAKLPLEVCASRLPPFDAVVFSAFNDLAALIGERAVLNDHPIA